jgi:hypothetical protein
MAVCIAQDSIADSTGRIVLGEPPHDTLRSLPLPDFSAKRRYLTLVRRR